MGATQSQPQEPRCSCTWEDLGGPEDGPMPTIADADEACPVHGREADPEGWAFGDEMEAQYEASLRAAGIDPEEEERRHRDAELLASAERLGLDVEEGRCDMALLAEDVDALLHAPASERPALVAALNAGERPEWGKDDEPRYMVPGIGDGCD